VIAESFARIFYRNAFNTGLLILECPEASKDIETGDELEVYPEEGKILNLTKNKTYTTKPLPQFMKEILEDGGLIPHIMKRLKQG
jgi:3-isopropylmalate/(R)-2-methylmalate dehydratase small subunit